METKKTNWIMTAAGAVALLLGMFIYANAVEKELPKKEMIEAVKKLEMVTFEYIAPEVDHPYDEEHILNPANWQAVSTPSCSSTPLPNAPCSVEVEETFTVGGNKTEIDFSAVTLNLTSVGTQRYIVGASSPSDNYANPINTQKP